jgi:hypothetical protein
MNLEKSGEEKVEMLQNMFLNGGTISKMEMKGRFMTVWESKHCCHRHEY